MQKRNYLELPKENGPRFYFRSEPLQKSKDELEEISKRVKERRYKL